MPSCGSQRVPSRSKNIEILDSKVSHSKRIYSNRFPKLTRASIWQPMRLSEFDDFRIIAAHLQIDLRTTPFAQSVFLPAASLDRKRWDGMFSWTSGRQICR